MCIYARSFGVAYKLILLNNIIDWDTGQGSRRGRFFAGLTEFAMYLLHRLFLHTTQACKKHITGSAEDSR